MRPGRFIRQLNEQERTALRQLYRQTKDADMRSRCQMILLSADGHDVAEIAKLTCLTRTACCSGSIATKPRASAGLEDRPQSGRPTKSR